MQNIQGVSETEGHILRTFSTHRKKKEEETSHKRVPWCTLFSTYDCFKYQNVRQAASCVTLQDGHLEQMSKVCMCLIEYIPMC